MGPMVGFLCQMVEYRETPNYDLHGIHVECMDSMECHGIHGPPDVNYYISLRATVGG